MKPRRLGAGSWYARDFDRLGNPNYWVDYGQTVVRRARGGYVVKAK